MTPEQIDIIDQAAIDIYNEHKVSFTLVVLAALVKERFPGWGNTDSLIATFQKKGYLHSIPPFHYPHFYRVERRK